MLSIGSVAPDFELKLQTGVRFRLSDQRNERNVVLHFSPDDPFGRSPNERSIFVDRLREIQSLDAVVVGVLAKPPSQKYRPGVNGYPFFLASDQALEVSRNYRAVWLRGLGIRKVTYVIDKHQTIRGIAHHELLVDQHWDHVIRVLRELMDEDRTRSYNRKAWDL
ncbi:MAG TPA: redoxin domain-containing protein [Bacteroidota bacterium]|nr:redoxin domain-containing protein [Bacteroidota bacterium]